jgi:alkylation response protein AidB-like acyl-CoA dehydrogenase
MLIDELEVASRFVPHLQKVFSERSLMELERSGGRILAEVFRERGEPAFLVPKSLGGGGGSLLELAQILRLVGARCPSLSIMMTMHHHAVGAFSRDSIAIPASGRLLERVAGERALVATAFAEGRPGSDILDSTVECMPLDDGSSFRVTGAKRPCCMSHHADFAIVGVAMQPGEGARDRGIALVDRTLEGVRAEDFWPGELLASTDSHCLVFDGVTIPGDCLLAPRREAARAPIERLAVVHAEMALSCLFQLMVSASYLGMATRLGETMLKRKAGSPERRLQVLSRLESSAMALYRLSQLLEEGDFSAYLLARAMVISHSVGNQIEQAVTEAVRALGGGVYLADLEAQYLVLASRCVTFHPPSEPLRARIVDGCYEELV